MRARERLVHFADCESIRTLSVHALEGDSDTAVALHHRDARARSSTDPNRASEGKLQRCCRVGSQSGTVKGACADSDGRAINLVV